MSAFDQQAIADALALVAPAETAFRSRWRWSTLARVDRELADRLQEQIRDYDAACITGTASDIREQSQAMVRGWRAACARLEAPLLADDAYFIGEANGLRVVVGEHQGSLGRVQIHDGRKVVLCTPDEVARMVAGLQLIAEAKNVFPNAEIIDLYPEYTPA